ncbi:C1 family peptidase 26-29-p [Lycorma delicatula]|uniref:C1 family peptidase 26-29-p n=1 Tax=Lycorma delicatula TaxID=130591 RepID=UPI003F50F604
MLKIHVCLLVLWWTSLHNVYAGDVPVFSNTYIAKAVLIIPYAEITEPISAWYDGPFDQSRIDYYGGMVKTYQLGKKFDFGTSLKIVPLTTEAKYNVDTCLQNNGTSEETRITAQSILPDLTGFKSLGTEIVNGMTCDVWGKEETIEEKVNNYTMFLMWKKSANSEEKVAIPIMYEMKGYNTLFGSHFDHYYIRYKWFSTEKPDQSVFTLPESMTCQSFPGPGSQYTYTFNPMKEFIHNDVKHIDCAWDEFQKYHNRTKDYKSAKEHDLRKHVFHQNFRFIQSKNRANLSYRLAVNHLADRTSDELKVLRGRRPSKVAYNGGSPFPYSSQFLAKYAKELPDDLDWRLFGAVTPVKDQSVCGSCWSFGTTGTVEGAYFVKTGHLVRLSQQALIDCSWGFGNNGCDGGEDFRSYEWIMKHGGLPSESDYGPYLGQDGYCHIKNLTMAAKITGFVNVTTNNEIALKTSLVKHGPISIAIDASQKSLSFYSNGIYYEPLCHSSEEQLDHAVLLVGYGKLNGEPYWLVKNSWSNYWGNDGYVLISPKNNNCGVMTAPTYVKM